MIEKSSVLCSWVQEKISDILGYPVSEDLVNNILSYESRREIKRHLSSILDANDERTRYFIDEFLKRWTPTANNAEVYKKDDQHVVSIPARKAEPVKPHGTLRTIDTDVGNFDDLRKAPTSMVVDTKGADFHDKNLFILHKKKQRSPFKQKSLSLISLCRDEDKLVSNVVLLPGRHPCLCLARIHYLVNNCVECGRIVCQQEGAGPCMFCGNLVCSPEDAERLLRDSKKSKKLKLNLCSQTTAETMNVEGRKNLSNQCSQIKDRKHREIVHTKGAENSHSKRPERKCKLYFDEIEDEDDLDLNRNGGPDNEVIDKTEDIPKFIISRNMIHPRIKMSSIKSHFPEEILVHPHTKENKCRKTYLRLQDKEIQEMTDEGICLGLDQPWASLIVSGIIKVTGRNRYTAHRGRLWIASTKNIPDEKSIKDTENEYRISFHSKHISFPKVYPSGALLGCVNLTDCITHEEYYSHGSDNLNTKCFPYLLVCETPEYLSVNLPIESKREIFKLQCRRTHATAKSILLGSAIK